MGLPVTMITETGNDRVGQTIKQFMEENGVNSNHVCMYQDGRTAISLAYLNERNDADYTFYKDYPNARLDVIWPIVNKDDIIMMGSYFVLNPILRDKVKEFLDYATKQEALIYYDINFRSSHVSEAIKLRSSILENFEYASIVRGSTEDFQNMFQISDPEKVYKQEVSYHCKQMLCTDAEGEICLFSPSVTKKYQVNKIETVSTIGAGDNFNAGIIFGLLKEGVSRDGIASITEEQWNRIIAHGMAFAAEVCQSLNNSISKEFANNYGRN